MSACGYKRTSEPPRNDVHFWELSGLTKVHWTRDGFFVYVTPCPSPKRYRAPLPRQNPIKDRINIFGANFVEKRPAVNFDVGALAAIAHANHPFDLDIVTTFFTALFGPGAKGTKNLARLGPDAALATPFIDADVNALFFGHGVYLFKNAA